MKSQIFWFVHFEQYKKEKSVHSVAQHSKMQMHISGCRLQHCFSTTVGLSLHLWAGVGQEVLSGWEHHRWGWGPVSKFAWYVVSLMYIQALNLIPAWSNSSTAPSSTRARRSSCWGVLIIWAQCLSLKTLTMSINKNVSFCKATNVNKLLIYWCDWRA